MIQELDLAPGERARFISDIHFGHAKAQPRQQQGREEEKNLEKKDSILAGAPPEHFLSPFLSELGLTMKQS